MKPKPPVAKRCLSRQQAAEYLGCSVPVIDWMLQMGKLPEVKLPVARNWKSGLGQEGTNKRVLIDVRDLDAVVDNHKNVRG